MTEDTSPENLRKFLESDDPALIQMGLSMAEGSGVSDEQLPSILRLYMWNDDKTIRAAAKSVFNKYAPAEIQAKVKENWKGNYRTISITGDKFPETIRPFLEAFKSQDDFAEIILEPLIKTLEDEYRYVRSNLKPSKIDAASIIIEIELALNYLIKALRDNDSRARQNAARALRKAYYNAKRSIKKNG